ncbi:MAG: D-alanine--D-alanine ligase [Nitrospirae bacterium]|nr:D-alanine--D-alanine ligase [Nitrospirota bacterium]
MKEKEMKKRKIGVLLGGLSAEREVSLRSGKAVFRALKSIGFNAVAIDAKGDFYAKLKKQKIEQVFIALHGGHGENGAVQGMLEIMNIPYTGSGVLASSLAMDKVASKKIFLYHHIPVPAFSIIERSALSDQRSAKNASRITNHGLRGKLGLPIVVKPATEGSSVGVEIVKDAKSYQKALKKAFAYGDTVLIEKYIRGQEVQIAILDNKVLGGVEVRPSDEFYSYKAKYTAGLTQYIFPPELDRTTYKKAEKAALAAHQALGCSGATRVDLIIDKHRNPYVLEVNTIPGMTETSLLPKIAKNAGLEFPELIRRILGD